MLGAMSTENRALVIALAAFALLLLIGWYLGTHGISEIW